MYAAGRGTVRLLLVVAFVVAVAGVPRRPRQPRSKASKVYRPNQDAAELLNHVMMYEKEWTNVLQEPIELLDEPPYKGRDLGVPPLMPKSDMDSSVTKEMHLYDVREIVAMVTKHYSIIGSFAEFGAKILRRALACYTFKRVFYQSKSIYSLMIREAEPNTVLQVANAFKKNNVSFIDILSAVPDDDQYIILLAYWESIKLLQHEGIQHLVKMQYPDELVNNMSDLIAKTRDYLINYCRPYPTDPEVYFRADIPEHKPLIRESSLDLMTTEEIVDMTQGQMLHMAQTASSLGVVTMSDHLWSSLFFYRGRPRPDSVYLDVDAPSEAAHSEAVHSEAAHSEAGSTTSEVGLS